MREAKLKKEMKKEAKSIGFVSKLLNMKLSSENRLSCNFLPTPVECSLTRALRDSPGSGF